MDHAASRRRTVNGQAIAYIYSRENEAEARQAKMLTVDEARRSGAAAAPMCDERRPLDQRLRRPRDKTAQGAVEWAAAIQRAEDATHQTHPCGGAAASR